MQRSAAPLFWSRKRPDQARVGDGRRSGLVKIVVFDETAGGASPGTSSMRGSRPEQRWRDRERQRQDQGPRLRLTKPERSGSVARRDRGHGLIRIERSWAPREGNRGSSMIGAEAGGSPSSEAPLDHVLRQGFGPTEGHGSSLHRRKLVGRVIRESNDPRGARHDRSVADAGKDASSPAGRSRPQGRERRRRVSSTRRLHVDHGSRFAAGERVRGDRGQTSK